MKDLTRQSPTDPFATMVSLTAAALTGGTAEPARPREQNVRSSGSLFARLERWLWNARQRERERALTTATDVADVEARLRARERQLLQRYY
jgi:hypothetical protein